MHKKIYIFCICGHFVSNQNSILFSQFFKRKRIIFTRTESTDNVHFVHIFYLLKLEMKIPLLLGFFLLFLFLFIFFFLLHFSPFCFSLFCFELLHQFLLKKNVDSRLHILKVLKHFPYFYFKNCTNVKQITATVGTTM